jgi:hypothetical protein
LDDALEELAGGRPKCCKINFLHASEKNFPQVYLFSLRQLTVKLSTRLAKDGVTQE